MFCSEHSAFRVVSKSESSDWGAEVEHVDLAVLGGDSIVDSEVEEFSPSS